MFNHNRGLWGYTGQAADGEPLTIQSTGIGGPSAIFVLEELIALGLERAIRVGTAGALDDTLGHGALVVVERAICADGTSRALGALGGAGGRSGHRGGAAALRAGGHTAPSCRATSSTRSVSPALPAGARVARSRWRRNARRCWRSERCALRIAVGCALAITDVLLGGRGRDRARGAA